MVDVTNGGLEGKAFLFFVKYSDGAHKKHQYGCCGNQKLPKSGTDWRLLSALGVLVVGCLQMGRDSHAYLIDLSHMPDLCRPLTRTSAAAAFR